MTDDHMVTMSWSS